jgi:hypothetical protein
MAELFLGAGNGKDGRSKRQQRGGELKMQSNTLRAIAGISVGLALVLCAAWAADAQDLKTAYPSMAPLEQ